MIDAFAQKLQALVRDRRGVDAEIVDHRRIKDAPKPSGPAIRLTLWSAGDIYSGGTYVDEMKLINMPAPDIGAALSVHFTYAVHDLSGQCDTWQLRVKGASAEELTALREIFSPTPHTGHFGNNMRPELVVDDIEQGF